MLAQGGLAVAIAVSYTQVRPDLNPRLILTATLLSVLLFEIVAGREGAALVESLGSEDPGAAGPPSPAEPARAT